MSETKTTTPDESTRPAEVEGRCNHPMTTAEGVLDRCARTASHNGDHNSHASVNRLAAKRKADAAAFKAWAEVNDPALKAKREAAHAKKVATLLALAEELGYKVAAPKA